METLNINEYLNREETSNLLKNAFKIFEDNKYNLTVKKGIYVYGMPGSGKTEFVIKILKELDYDIIKYDAGDFRNKSIVDTISKHNMSDKNIMSLFYSKIKKIAIIMDEIDGMNSGDKGGINTLIKLIRPKKTKKQKGEEISMNPIVCIGNYYVDKKIKELMKVCNTIELTTPTHPQIKNILNVIMPTIDECLKNGLVDFIQGDLRKLENVYNIYKSNGEILKSSTITNIFQVKSYNDDTKDITTKLLTDYVNISDHNTLMNEADRTIVGLLWHENIIDVIGKLKPDVSIPFYLKQLDNICFSDYIDRITFQKQIWQFNEMSSLIKTFQNNKMYHETFKKKRKSVNDIRFTKVLTKYSTEYNNSLFIQNLCQQLGMDKKDLLSFFTELRLKHGDGDIVHLFENYEINKLDIVRIYKYIDKHGKCDDDNDEDDASSKNSI